MKSLENIQVRRITATIPPGSAIGDTLKEAQSFAKAFDCVVEFKFNDILIKVKADSDVTALANKYYERNTRRSLKKVKK